VILANCCLRWMVHSQWPTCRKPPLPQTSSRYFSHSPSGTPFISLSAKNMLLVSICSNRHVSPHCGYCKSLLEASKRRDHRKFKKKKQNTSTQQLHNHFLWTASSHHSSAQSWYPPHYSCNRHKEPSHTSSSEHGLWAVSISCPLVGLSHYTELFLTYFYGGYRILNSQGKNSVYTTLGSWKSSPLAGDGCNSYSVLFLSCCCCSSTSKDQTQQTVTGPMQLPWYNISAGI